LCALRWLDFLGPAQAVEAGGGSVGDRLLNNVGLAVDGGYAGAAYLFALPYPLLGIVRNAGTVSIKWVTAETGLVLQQTVLLGASAAWSDSTNSVSINGQANVVQQTVTNGPATRFYRLRRP